MVHLQKKLELLRCFTSQMDKVVRGTEMSLIEAAEANAIFRGIHARTQYAEGFVSRRFLINSVITRNHVESGLMIEQCEKP